MFYRAIINILLCTYVTIELVIQTIQKTAKLKSEAEAHSLGTPGVRGLRPCGTNRSLLSLGFHLYNTLVIRRR
jgi:hypothetical protein